MFAKHENGTLIPAPRKIEIVKDGKTTTVFNPPSKLLIERGYKPVEYGTVPQDAPNGYTTSYVETDTVIKVVYTVRPIDAEYIRARRESECFPIVNRGKPWYDALTAVQRIEIEEWYKAWLDAPATLIIPDKPEWLNE